MKQAKFGVLGAGVLGLICIFLPFVSFGPMSMSLWDMKSAWDGQIYLTLAGYIIAAVVGGMAVAKGGLAKPLAGAAIAGLVLSAFKLRDTLGEGFGIGPKLMLLASVIGIVSAVLTIVKPEAEG